MPPVRVKYVASFSSQDPRHTVENLVKGRGSWLSHPTEKMSRLQADLQLEWATTITYIDIGNAGSVMVSVEVGRSSWPTSQPLVTLLPAVSLMTAEEWRAGRNISTVRMFKPVDLSSEALKEKWDKVRVVCLQPFRKDTTQFGLSLFRLHTNVEVSSEAALDKRIIDLDSNTPQTALKKDELVSRMNLSEVKKKTISQKIGWLENKVLNNSEEGNAGPPLNPLMSPVSRAGRLISMASKPQTKMGADIHKSELECEALEFLISLNLSLEDIYSLKVLGVRKQFEKQRQKELSHDEKVIFKDIALDYAKQRLDSLEKQQNSAVKSSENGFLGHERKSFRREKEKKLRSLVKSNENAEREKSKKNMPLQDTHGLNNKKINQSANISTPSRSVGKFTFKRIESSGRSKDLLKNESNSPKNVSSDRLKLRENDNLSFELLSSPHRNSIALSDSKVVTPKKPSRGRPKKTTPQPSLNKQSKLDIWISPKAKRKKENKSYTLSSSDTQEFAFDVDSIEDGFSIIDDEDRISTASSKRTISGGFIDDVPTSQKANAKNKSNSFSSKEDGHQTITWISRSTNYNDNTPGYCLGSKPLDKYGTSKGRKGSMKDGLENGGGSSPLNTDCNIAMVECPVCSEFFQSQEIEDHAASCGLTVLVESDSDSSDNQQTSVKRHKHTKDVEECPVCGALISKSELNDHAADCASAMFD
ncbi:uncharacterized protein [Cherax quadricarinatus]